MDMNPQKAPFAAREICEHLNDLKPVVDQKFGQMRFCCELVRVCLSCPPITYEIPYPHS